MTVLFNEFDVDPRCLRVLETQGIIEPTPVQQESIPVVLEGRDVIVSAQTGTGKTLAFALPAMTKLCENPSAKGMMLVLTPTRELAQQVHSVVEPLAKALKMRSACMYGGAGLVAQAQAVRNGCNVLVATPGRLLDHIGRGNVRFKNLSVLVLDEADRMLDMGFLPDVRRILSHLPRERQTLMFSATFPDEIARLASVMQQDPVRIKMGPVTAAADSIRQGIYTVAQGAKSVLLSKLLQDPEVTSALVFLRTKHRTDNLAKTLHREGYKVQAIHGDRSQHERQKALKGFREGRYNILVATDVAARGLDIEGISHVINYDVPKTSEDYIHRIGRTGRASAAGDAITFVCPDEFMDLRNIETGLGKRLPRHDWEGAVPVVSLFQTPEERAATAKKSGGRARARSMFRRR